MTELRLQATHNGGHKNDVIYTATADELNVDAIRKAVVENPQVSVPWAVFLEWGRPGEIVIRPEKIGGA